jgi:hypothetical protein
MTRRVEESDHVHQRRICINPGAAATRVDLHDRRRYRRRVGTIFSI